MNSTVKIILRIGVGVGIFMTLLFLFFFWYKMTYSMSRINAYEINSAYTHPKMLIATQGSKYKNEVVRGVLDFLQTKQIYVRVCDVSELAEVSIDSWEAVLILHTWEMSIPPKEVGEFLKNQYDSEKVLVLCTSGEGSEKIGGVDAITGASSMEEVSDHVKDICDKLSMILQLESAL